jgi:2-phospho-L-lactate guanylyltransferase
VPPAVDLLVPVNALDRAKSRLREALPESRSEAHQRLTLALARDTVRAARAAESVRRIVVTSPDPRVLAAFATDGVRLLPDRPDLGLNAAVLRGVGRRLRGDPGIPAAVLHADLPALRPAELDAALGAAVERFGPEHGYCAFCPDAAGTGTTLLVCTGDAALRPRFGPDSAAEHARTGAFRLDGDWPGLRRDVDTAQDLREAAELGLGPLSAEAAQALFDGQRYEETGQTRPSPPGAVAGGPGVHLDVLHSVRGTGREFGENRSP